MMSQRSNARRAMSLKNLTTAPGSGGSAQVGSGVPGPSINPGGGGGGSGVPVKNSVNTDSAPVMRGLTWKKFETSASAALISVGERTDRARTADSWR